MSAEVESAVFARQGAWHGHGTVVERFATEDEIEAAVRLREEAHE